MTLRIRHDSGFSLSELLLVLCIIAILAALLLPAISKQKVQAKRLVCLNNQRQLIIALTVYAHDDPRGSFGGNPAKLTFWPYIDENWLYQSQRLPLQVFFCPATLNGLHASRWHRGPDNPDLAIPAEDRMNDHGYSYDPLLWFADMEGYWNGNLNCRSNSRFVPKTMSNIGTYAHTNSAFGMQGQQFGPSRIWTFTDNDIISGNKFWPESNNNHGSAGANVGFADGHVEWVSSKDYVYKYEASQDNNRTRTTLQPSL